VRLQGGFSAKDEINRLLDKKVITNARKYTQDGASDEADFKRDENGLIKDNLIIKGNNLLALHTLGKLSVINF
jgi:adenine-specific DNA-methyltransferase